MSISKDSIFIKCPFFKAHDARRIFCEVIVKDISVHLSFMSADTKRQYEKKHCEHGYGSCPIYKINERKYDEMGNDTSV